MGAVVVRYTATASACGAFIASSRHRDVAPVSDAANDAPSMSEHITHDMVEAAKARDARVRLIGEHFAIEQELRDSVALRAILRQITALHDNAVRQIADTSPHDTATIAELLVNIKTLFYIRDVFDNLRVRAQHAAQEIHVEDTAAGLTDE